MRRIGRFFKRLLIGFLLVLGILIIYNWNLIGYGLRQARGQLHIVWNAEPVADYLADPDAPDTLKAKLRFIEEVRRFAVDSLGLSDTKNYRTLYDQQGKPVMWVVTASEPFALKPKLWDFPVIGEVPYKGYFDEALALRERSALEHDGYDVRIQNPGAWSTLGWFRDPILSGMLEHDEGNLASLIIHELVHSTIFVKDSVEFNENLASFIGDRGAELFLKSRYGADSPEYKQFVNDDGDFTRFVAHILNGADLLDSLYATFSGMDDETIKLHRKQQMIRTIVSNLDTLTVSSGKSYASIFRNHLPNNAYFLSFRRYQSKQEILRELWIGRFDGNFKRFLDYFTENYPSL